MPRIIEMIGQQVETYVKPSPLEYKSQWMTLAITQPDGNAHSVLTFMLKWQSPVISKENKLN